MSRVTIAQFVEDYSRESEFLLASHGIGWLYALGHIDRRTARQEAEALIALHNAPYTYEFRGNIIWWIRDESEKTTNTALTVAQT